MPRETESERNGRQEPPATPGRVLFFTIEDALFALAVSSVSGLGDCTELRPVHRASAIVLGLTEWRGQLLTVLDLPRSLGLRCPDSGMCFLHLAPPLGETAFRLPATVRLGPEPARFGYEPSQQADGIVSGHVLHEGSRVPLIDPCRLIERLERTLCERI